MSGTTSPPVFLNPRGGSASKVRDALAGDGRVVLHETDPAALKDAVGAAIARHAPRVIISGGDGSIASAASVLIGATGQSGKHVELGVLPGGTFNHFAKEHGIPEDPAEALSIAIGENTAEVDAARVNGHVFLNTSSVGAYVRFVDIRERLEPRLGYWIASFIAALRTLAWQRTFNVELEVDGEVRHYRSALVFIGVGERETKLPTLGKRVDSGKGGLHVIVVQGAVRGRLLMLGLAAVARGLSAVDRTPHLDSFMVERCTIDMRRKAGRVSQDGELVMMEAPLRYEILRGALTVAVPTGYLA